MENENRAMSFEEFERDWKRKHKTSIPRKTRVSSAREFFWIAFWLIVATGAAIFSAAHTIPAAELTILKDVASRSQLAITAFIIVELVIFGAAAGRREIRWLKWLLIGAVLVALAGNISSSIKAVYENGGDLINQFGGVLLAIIAPLTALAAGEVLHIQLDKRAAKQRASNDEFDVKFKDMEAKILQAYTKYERAWKTAHRPDQPSNLIKNNQISPRNKPSPRLKKALDWLEENPDKLDTPPRELEQEIGVSYGTIYSAQRQLKSVQNGHYTNGHSPDDVLQ